jgi:hypothetical protein
METAKKCTKQFDPSGKKAELAQGLLSLIDVPICSLSSYQKRKGRANCT